MLKKTFSSPITYKLSVDILVLWIVFTIGFFIVDIIVPNILTLYITKGELFIIGAILIILTSITHKTAHIQK